MKKEYIAVSVQITTISEDVITTSVDIENVSGLDYAIFDPRR